MDLTTISNGATALAYEKPVEELGAPREGETTEEAFLRAKASEVYLKLRNAEQADDQTEV